MSEADLNPRPAAGDDAPARAEALGLIRAVCDERATNVDRRRLAELMRGDPQVRRRYVDAMVIDAMLRFDHAAELAVADRRPVDRREGLDIPTGGGVDSVRRFRWSGFALAAGVLIAAGVVAAIAASLYAPAATPRPRIAVATLIDTANAAWGRAPATPQPGGEMVDGRYELAAGVVQIDFLDGTEVRIEGPASFDLITQSRAALHRGKLAARIAPGRTGFRVDAPGVSVVDLGTEFGVSVDDGGVSRVFVFDGAVEAHVPRSDDATGAPLRVRMVQRQAKAFDSAAGVIEDIPFDASEFSGVGGRYASFGDLFDGPARPRDTVNFAHAKLVAHPFQDAQHGLPTLAQVLDSGRTLKLTGNAWKAVALEYTLTERTVLEFDFRSDRLGELLGVGFIADEKVTAATPPVFVVQFAEHIAGFIEQYAGYEGHDWQRFRIPVGKHLTGVKRHLIFVADDDAAGEASAYFRDVRVYEAPPDAEPATAHEKQDSDLTKETPK